MYYGENIQASGFATPRWVQKRYGISNSTMYAWIAEGHLPRPVKIGPRAVRFYVPDLMEFEERRRTSEQG